MFAKNKHFRFLFVIGNFIKRSGVLKIELRFVFLTVLEYRDVQDYQSSHEIYREGTLKVMVYFLKIWNYCVIMKENSAIDGFFVAPMSTRNFKVGSYFDIR